MRLQTRRIGMSTGRLMFICPALTEWTRCPSSGTSLRTHARGAWTEQERGHAWLWLHWQKLQRKA